MAALMARMTGPSPPGISSSPPSTSPPAASQPPNSLPVRTIPGSYGWPLLGPISDRLDYFWFQGPETFFRKRIEKHKSTVFRTNVPPTFPWFVGVNPNVVAVLDVKSFSHLFDMEIVEKTDVLVGDFMPSTKFTGDLRVCAYLDTSETKHTQLKKFAMDILKRSSSKWVQTMVSKLDIMWAKIESELSKPNPGTYIPTLQQFLFEFLSICIVGADPSTSPELSKNGFFYLDTWLALQLLPITYTGSFGQPLAELTVHSFPLPFWLAQGGYNKLVEFVEKEGKEAIQIGQNEFGLTPNEAVHNLLFILGFNAYGGFSVFFLSLFNALGDEKNKGVLEKIKNEVREKVGTDSSKLSFESIKEMELVQSFVYETLRLNPPVPLQYARARKDFKLASHDSVFEIKKGELLCGYQALVMRDSEVFDDPESFEAERFTKEKGKELLNYLFWSNGPQTGTPSHSNKQCAAKDVVTLTASLFLANLFQRYDSITISSGSITAVERVAK
ncbi:OLC1v1024797C1 [Oldenlandia corymbosa var. corymbosa]|uniref:OLC1v1024797C1 n=1 Tax=Oldenlandia corymbosa var. corymbosa TaxID=529605 RepID=A0AAV1C3K9_OLDCO|nr:OLC1v1024797C1 [Oldenlandia corymbosa var. corymbosa]